MIILTPPPYPPVGSSSSRSRNSSARSVTSTRMPEMVADVSDPRMQDPYMVGSYPITAIPGYGGHTPGVYPEVRFGASKQRMNVQAYLERHNLSPRSVRVHNNRGLNYRPGFDVVGYTGYVPGKSADNVFGETFARADFSSQHIRKQAVSSEPRGHTDYVEQALRLFEGTKPSSVHGNFPLYSRPQNRVVPPPSTC